MVERFVAGEDLDAAMAAVAGLRAPGLRTTLDILGESVTDAAAAEAAAGRYLELLDRLAADGADGNVSLKLTQMGLDVDAGVAAANLARIAERAAVHHAFVRVDMEDSARTAVTLDLARAQFAHTGNVGVVIQAYLHRSAADVAALNREGIRVRLCKGAYNEPSSVAFPSKAEVDAVVPRRSPSACCSTGSYPAFATHDERLIRDIVAMRGARTRSRPRATSSRCSTASAATFRSASRRRARRSASTFPGARSGIRTSCAASPSGRRTCCSCCARWRARAAPDGSRLRVRHGGLRPPAARRSSWSACSSRWRAIIDSMIPLTGISPRTTCTPMRSQSDPRQLPDERARLRDARRAPREQLRDRHARSTGDGRHAAGIGQGPPEGGGRGRRCRQHPPRRGGPVGRELGEVAPDLGRGPGLLAAGGRLRLTARQGPPPGQARLRGIESGDEGRASLVGHGAVLVAGGRPGGPSSPVSSSVPVARHCGTFRRRGTPPRAPSRGAGQSIRVSASGPTLSDPVAR